MPGSQEGFFKTILWIGGLRILAVMDSQALKTVLPETFTESFFRMKLFMIEFY
jgi:hypothetical protein